MSKRDGILSTSDYELSVTPFIRSANNYDRDAVSEETGINCQVDPETGEFCPSLTVQSSKDEVDINVIVKRFGLTGQLPVGAVMPTYGDFSSIGSYQQALNALMAADDTFMQMPAEVRARFNNDPARFVDFCSDPENLDECRKLGLAPAAEVIPEAVSSTPLPDKPLA